MAIEKNYVLRGTITKALIPQSQRVWLDRYRSWRRFHRGVRRRGLPLLKNLSSYPRCVLVAGCQRSGTTMLTRLIARAPGFTRLCLTADDELDAALALAGFVDLPNDLRYCLQTTYLNERFIEYRQLRPDQRLIWVVRNPYSVVYSMLHNWGRFALNELYDLAVAEIDRRNQHPYPLSLTPTPVSQSDRYPTLVQVRLEIGDAVLRIVKDRRRKRRIRRTSREHVDEVVELTGTA